MIAMGIASILLFAGCLRRLYLLGALGVAWSYCSASYAAPQTLIIVTSELPPYTSAKPQDSFLSALLQEVGKEMGVKFEFRFMPWARGEQAVDSLQAWATMPYVPTPEREKKFLFSIPLYAKRTMLFHYSEEQPSLPKTFTDLRELSRLRVGGVRGYYYESVFSDAGIKLSLASSEEQSFRMLRAGRVDLVPAVEVVGWNIIRTIFPPEEHAHFRVMDTPLNVGYNYLMTSRHYPQAEQLLERFNHALRALELKGVYRSLAIQHGIVKESQGNTEDAALMLEKHSDSTHRFFREGR
ncbi:ABC transporter substrate-binding protein [Pseudomonas sp. 8Z]|uniref:substrate-binding periplasmic protein n=1 Tax=Pseudomonas sp. 8Z TaxID=2653166 RepID=UPI0012F1B3C9|nr:transporter substrate-binding domain-containing protein [Pseudomonas sp. 8Z]VXD04943.1 ABC transporter substrate-binding protein [Pseudomonas sp. 8Z]